MTSHFKVSVYFYPLKKQKMKNQDMPASPLYGANGVPFTANGSDDYENWSNQLKPLSGLTKLEKLGMDLYIKKSDGMLGSVDEQYYRNAAIASITQAKIFFQELKKSEQ